jgi:predicted nucleotidyltransferase
MALLSEKEVQDKLKLIKDITLEVVPETEAIYLFGSYAYGKPHADSDIDICIIFPDNSSNVFVLKGKIRERIFFKINKKMDILVRKSSKFYKEHIKGFVEYEIFEKGVPIYEINANKKMV